MGRKKNKIEEFPGVIQEVVPEVTPAEPQEPVQLKLTQEEILRLESLEHQSRHGLAVYELESIKRELFLNHVDPQGQIKIFNNKISAANTLSMNAKSQYLALREQIGQRLGIKLDDHSYDPLSGNVFLANK